MPIFETSAAISATVDIGIGDVRISTGDRVDTIVEVRPSDPGAELDVRAAEQTHVEFNDGRLLVKAPKTRALGLFGKQGSVDVEILVPTGSQFRGTAEIATFHATGTLGECFVRTATGDIHLERTGELDAHTSAGAVIVAGVAGNAQLSTSTGAIRVGAVDGTAVIKNSDGDSRAGSVTGNLTARASNGNIVVEHAGADVTASSASGDVRIGQVTRGVVSVKTASGELEVGVPAGTVAYLDLHTSYGNLHNRLTPADTPAAGEDKVEIRARTSYGDIIIRRP